jgi:hypothetical protein
MFFSYENGSENKFAAGFYVHHRIVSAVKGVELVSDGMSYIVLRGHWCDIIVQTVHAPSEAKSDDSRQFL